MSGTLLSDEQRSALSDRPEGIEVEDPQTRRVYVLADAELHRRALRALQETEDRAAIQSGIDDMEAGRVVPFEEVDRRIREKLGLAARA
jgi:predicted transcriptional regulator